MAPPQPACSSSGIIERGGSPAAITSASRSTAARSCRGRLFPPGKVNRPILKKARGGRRKGTENRTMRREVLERSVLSGLKTHLLSQSERNQNVRAAERELERVQGRDL